MAADPLFGWDLTFKTVERDIKRKSDILVAFIHWNLTKRGFRTIGVGDEVGSKVLRTRQLEVPLSNRFQLQKFVFQRTLSGDEEKSEILPTGWNDKENYTLRYVLDDKLYILHGLTTDGSLIVNLMVSEVFSNTH